MLSLVQNGANGLCFLLIKLLCFISSMAIISYSFILFTEPKTSSLNIVSILRWFRDKDLFGSQIPMTTVGFELQIFCIRSSDLT